jgi:hypothetical protein
MQAKKEAGVREDKAKDDLVTAMLRHELNAYHDEESGFTITVKRDLKVKVARDR